MDNLIIKSFLPEIFFSLAILFQLVFNAKLINNIKFNFPIINKEIFIQTFFILFSLFVLLVNLKIESSFSNFIFINDEGSRVIKILFVLISLALLFPLIRSFKLQSLNFFEFFTIFLLSVLALLLLLNSYDLISVYLIIEMQALSFYVLACFRRNSAFSTEAGLKYFISGSFISGIFLLGCSFIYGGSGTLNFLNLSLLLSFDFTNENLILKYLILIGIILILISFLFKISSAPFHFWSPDVYEGSPLSTTIIFSILPKIIIFTFIIRWLSTLSFLFDSISFIFTLSGFCSVFIGTFFAIKQKRLKRLIVFSSIAQVGFLVVSLSAHTILGFSSLYFYLFIYIITSIVLWSILILFYTFQNTFNTFENKTLIPLFVSNISNLFSINPIWAYAIALIFFSMAGIPPLCGFFSKVFVLSSLVQINENFISIMFLTVSAISTFYYLRILKIVFFENKHIKITNKSIIIFNSYLFNIEIFLIVFYLFLLLLFFFYPTNILLFSQYILLNFYNI